MCVNLRRTVWKNRPKKVIALYFKRFAYQEDSLSRTGHEKSCLNPGGPSSKAKYSLETDSEPVP